MQINSSWMSFFWNIALNIDKYLLILPTPIFIVII